MPFARKKSASGIYHVMVRGNNKQDIFFSRDDYEKFLSLLYEKVRTKSMALYAWCLMPNHIHLLVKEKTESLDKILGSVLTAYVMWINRKYARVGHLFQSRFKSQPVEDETYFLRVVRYIHRNPVKGNLCSRMEDYPYSSYSYYFRSGKFQADDLVFHMIRKDEFERYHLEEDDENIFLSFNDTADLEDDEIIDKILETGQIKNIDEVKSLPGDQRAHVIQMLLQSGISYRRINGITGISISEIRKISRDLHQQ